jgi:hypothetical protein
MAAGLNLDFSLSHKDRGIVAWKGLRVRVWFHHVQIIIASAFEKNGKPAKTISGMGRVGFWEEGHPSGQQVMIAPYPLLGQGEVLEFVVFRNYAGQGRFELDVDSAITHQVWTEH